MQAKRNRHQLKARQWPHIGMMSILAASRAAREFCSEPKPQRPTKIRKLSPRLQEAKFQVEVAKV